MKNVIAALQERGLVEAMTGLELQKMTEQPIKVYCGFDPTSDSLHLGNLVGIIVLEWFRRCGHRPVPLVGGATGMIGDPSGKSTERNLLSPEVLQHNVAGITSLLNKLLNRDNSCSLPVLNNYDWFKNWSLLDFLRDIGKHFRLGVMLSKEMVKTRLEKEEGMSFTELSYQLLQGYDFLHLYQNESVVLQIGGSDQWGNITAGTDLVRKLLGQQVHGLTFPLLTKSDGTKFGKSEQGAIWLSADKLNPYQFYQHLYRVKDEDVGKLLRFLTFLPIDTIQSLEEQHLAGELEPNALQKKLAEEVTRFVHGEESLKLALEATHSLAPGKETKLDVKAFEFISAELPTLELSLEEVVDQKLIDLLKNTQISPSKSEARKMIRNGGIALNNAKIQDEEYVLKATDLVENQYLLVAAGKKNKFVLRIK